MASPALHDCICYVFSRLNICHSVITLQPAGKKKLKSVQEFLFYPLQTAKNLIFPAYNISLDIDKSFKIC